MRPQVLFGDFSPRKKHVSREHKGNGIEDLCRKQARIDYLYLTEFDEADSKTEINVNYSENKENKI